MSAKGSADNHASLDVVGIFSGSIENASAMASLLSLPHFNGG
jgi:hypothetical protein